MGLNLWGNKGAGPGLWARPVLQCETLRSHAPRSSPQPPRPGRRGQSEVEPQNKGPLQNAGDSGLASEGWMTRWTEEVAVGRPTG